jgi:hypothetical protein
MQLLRNLRFALILNVLTMLLQAGFAGRMLGGDRWAVNLHETTAKCLVLGAWGLLALSTALRVKSLCPLWVPLISGALAAAEVLEFAAGQFHKIALHVPLGVAIFGGALSLMFWSVREKRVTREVRA